MKRRSLALGVLVTALSGAVVTAAPGAINATYRAAVYEIREDGKGRRLVAQPDPPVSALVRSSGGRSIVYAKQVDGDMALFAAETSGANPVRLSPPGISVDERPIAEFSPDGRMIVFTSYVGCGFRCAYRSLYLVSRDGSELRHLVENGSSPSWAPDGRRLAYTGREGIGVIDIVSNVAEKVAFGYRPIWAPRGDRIAFNATRGGYGVACFVNSDGSRLRCTRGRSLSGFVWSRDGKRVAFRQATPHRLGVVDSDARRIRYLGNHGRTARPGAWSPDGKRLAFSFDSPFFRAIYVLRLAAPGRPARIVATRDFLSDLRWRGRYLSYVAVREEPA